jgi:hypothetical protein
MRFGTSGHIFNIHDVQLIIIFISLTKIKDIVENLDELPNRILPNLAHLLILCAFTSVMCGVNKEVNENNNNKNQIQSWSFIYKHGEHRQQSKGEKTHNYEPNEFDRMRVKQFLSETVAMHPQYWSRVVRVSSTNPISYASDAMVGRCRSTMRRLDNLKR